MIDINIKIEEKDGQVTAQFMAKPSKTATQFETEIKMLILTTIDEHLHCRENQNN